MQLVSLDSHSTYHIHAPLALTGKGLVPEEEVLVKVERGVITSLTSGRGGSIPLQAGKRQNFFRLDEGFTLMPCLIDAHVHLAFDGGDPGRDPFPGNEWEALQERVLENLQRMSRAGIGFIRDGGDRRGINLELRDCLQEPLEGSGDYRGPRIISTGEAVRAAGGYGSFLGRGCASPGEIPVMIDRLWSSGVDQLKIVASGIVSFSEYNRVTGNVFSAEEMTAASDHARERGLKVMAHASSAEAVARAVQAGVDSVEHGYYVRTETLQLMAEKQIAWVPTVIPLASQIREPWRRERQLFEIDLIKRIYEEHLRKIEFALHCGVPLGVGTDAGAPGVRHGASLLEEMLLYEAASIPNRSVLQAAAVNNAEIIGKGRAAGALAEGLKPHLIVVRGNPLEDLAVLEETALHFMPW